ncbi:MAG: PhnD/SsuA/transferrin family substrate-binding protein [Myxococcaceae bacterium]
MRYSMRMKNVVLAAALLLPFAASAKDAVTLGVFLPTTMNDGQARFEASEQLGAALEKSLGQKVIVRNFGRWEDFSKAAKGQLDVAVVDAWAAVQLSGNVTPVALGAVDGDTWQRWAVVTRGRTLVKDLDGKRLAVPRGVKSLDPKFVSNVIFAGDLRADRHFKFVPVPTAESALAALETKSADAALVPAQHVPKGAHVSYRSAKLLGVVVLDLKKGGEDLRPAFTALEKVGPFDRFVAPDENELNALKKLLTKGPPARTPVLASHPMVRADADGLVDMKQVGLVLPSFLEYVHAPTETPDD